VKKGIGRITYLSGNYYEGEWIDDMKEGKGKMLWANEKVIIGVISMRETGLRMCKMESVLRHGWMSEVTASLLGTGMRDTGTMAKDMVN
jgi:hypothetical protein